MIKLKDNIKYSKSIDVIAWLLIVIGGLNWGFVGLFGINPVELIFGSILSRIIFTIVGIGAIYEVVLWRKIQDRWECSSFFEKAETPSP